VPSVFISYSHTDQSIARRVANRLSADGIDAWLDERELRLGRALEPTIEAQINHCDLVVPIGTTAATQSKWVAKELSFATQRNPPKSVCPLLVERVQADPLFAAHLGLNAMDPYSFEGNLLTLAREVVGGELPEANRSRLLADVRSVASKEPALSILVAACLDGPGLSDTTFETVMSLPYHILDYAINALCDGCADQNRTRVAWHAAYLFKERGAGFYALEKYAKLGEDNVVLDTAIGTKLPSARHTAALRILSLSPEPNDRALASFIFHNSSSLSPPNTETVVQLICYPHRKARDSTVNAALHAITLVPTSGDLRRLWRRWIQGGQFDGVDPEALTRRQAILDLGKVLSIGSQDWHDLTEAFSQRIRRLARTPDRKSIEIAVDYLITAAREHSPLLPDMYQQLRAATGSAEWHDWKDSEEMSIYIDEHLACARGERDRRGAIARYQEIWQTVKDAKRSRATSSS
jgi:hypothetical protein